ncbi:Hypp2651 [Branchiostoma lanceolatum]|uniref:Hypp2651 protein n=1 Tax=Branchiostoma lanceolatum TaxID=7740 RepID=A0A8J9ZTH2_BRALA|nr:Hypp2651 [Branchiostoma lanceolatum]
MFVARIYCFLRILLLIVEVTLSTGCVQDSRVTHSEIYNGVCYAFSNIRVDFNTFVNTGQDGGRMRSRVVGSPIVISFGVL